MATREEPTVEVAAPIQNPAASASPPRSPVAAIGAETSPQHEELDGESACLANTFLGDVPEDLVCGCCGRVPREPLVTKCCSQVFSQACLRSRNTDRFATMPENESTRKRSLSRSLSASQPSDIAVVRGKSRTPCCLAQTELAYEVDPERRERVGSLVVKCGNEGCKWVGAVTALFGEHCTSCEFGNVRCAACERLVQRRELETHQRESCRNRRVQCRLCEEECTYAEIMGLDAPFTQKHRCSKALTSCPNHCKSARRIERGRLSEHLKVCPLQTLECEFKVVGCKARLNRRSLARHMKDQQQEHMLMMLSAFQMKMTLVEGEIDFLMRSLCNPATHTSLACMSSHIKMGRLRLEVVGDSVTFRLTNFEHLSRFSEDDGKWVSPTFYFASNYPMQLVVYPAGHGGFTGQSVSVYLNVSKPEAEGQGNTNSDASWPMDCAYVALQISILPQVSCSSRPSTASDEGSQLATSSGYVSDDSPLASSSRPRSVSNNADLMEPKPISFRAHVCTICRHLKKMQTIPESETDTEAEVGAKEDFVGPDSLTEAGLLFQDSLVFRVEQTLCDCT